MKPLKALFFSSELAQKIGLNDALVLCYIHEQREHTPHSFEGRRWVHYNNAEWQAQFPFWRLRTLHRTLKRLEERGFILLRVLRMPAKKKFYSLDASKLDIQCLLQKQGDSHETIS